MFGPDLENIRAPVRYLPVVNIWGAEVKRSTQYTRRVGLRKGEATPSFSSIQDPIVLRTFGAGQYYVFFITTNSAKIPNANTGAPYIGNADNGCFQRGCLHKVPHPDLKVLFLKHSEIQQVTLRSCESS